MVEVSARALEAGVVWKEDIKGIVLAGLGTGMVVGRWVVVMVR